jgi:predicted Zn-dependent protease
MLSCMGLMDTSKPKGIEMRRPDSENPSDRALIASLVKLAKAASMDVDKLRVAFAKTPHANAMTVGTDTFVFCEGLSKMPEGLLDGVMAHEVAHAARDHSAGSADFVNKLGTITNIAGTILGHDEGTKDEVTSWVVDVAFAPYSRGQELEADKLAVSLLQKAGYRTEATEVMCQALEWLAQQEPDAGGGFLSTHPSIADRVKTLRKDPELPKATAHDLTRWECIKYLMAMIRASLEIRSVSEREQEEALMKRVQEDGIESVRSELQAYFRRFLEAQGKIKSRLEALQPPGPLRNVHRDFLAFLNQSRAALSNITRQLEDGKQPDFQGFYEWAAEWGERYSRNLEKAIKPYDITTNDWTN